MEQEQEHRPTRDELRTKLLSSHKPKSKKIYFFGMPLEIRQPSLDVVMSAREEPDPAARAAMMIVNYACVPGTDERVFEEGDIETIKKWPFGDDFVRLQTAITELTGLDIGEAEKDLQQDPLASESSESASS